jgi:hypothetical protein
MKNRGFTSGMLVCLVAVAAGTGSSSPAATPSSRRSTSSTRSTGSGTGAGAVRAAGVRAQPVLHGQASSPEVAKLSADRRRGRTAGRARRSCPPRGSPPIAAAPRPRQRRPFGDGRHHEPDSDGRAKSPAGASGYPVHSGYWAGVVVSHVHIYPVVWQAAAAPRSSYSARRAVVVLAAAAQEAGSSAPAPATASPARASKASSAAL